MTNLSARQQHLLVLGMIGLVGLTAAGSTLFVHQACFEAFPFAKPDPGTPRAGYCETVENPNMWISLTLVPVLGMMVFGLFARRRPWWVILCAGTICLLVVVNAVVVHNLDYALPFP